MDESLKPELRERVETYLRDWGMIKVLSISSCHPDVFDRLRLNADDPLRRAVTEPTPANANPSVKRTTLLPGLLEHAHQRQHHVINKVELFELSKVSIPAEGDGPPNELERVAGIIGGSPGSGVGGDSRRSAHFSDIKRIVEGLLDRCGVSDYTLADIDHPTFRSGGCAEIRVGDERLCVLGEVHPDVLKNCDLSHQAYLFELDFDKLVDAVEASRPIGVSESPNRASRLAADAATPARRGKKALVSRAMLFAVLGLPIIGLIAFLVISQNRPPSQLQKAPEDPLITKGMLYLRNKQYMKAEEQYKAAIAKNPTSAIGYVELAKTLIAQGVYRQAMQNLREALVYDPISFEAHYHIAVVYYGLRRMGKAISALKQALAFAQDGQTHHLLGECYMATGNHKKAEEALKRARQLTPNDADVYISLGRVSIVNDNSQQAIFIYQAALGLPLTQQQRRQIYVALASVYNRVGQFAQALEMCDKLEPTLPEIPKEESLAARRIRQNHALLYLYRAKAHIGLKDYAKAVDTLQAAVNLNPKVAAHHYRLGLAYIGSKNYEGAAEAFGQAVSLKPAFVNASLRLAAAYLALGKPERAQSECQRVLEMSGLTTEQQAKADKLLDATSRELGNR